MVKAKRTREQILLSLIDPTLEGKPRILQEIKIAEHDADIHLGGILGFKAVSDPKVRADVEKAERIEEKAQAELWRQQPLGTRIWLRVRGMRPGQ